MPDRRSARVCFKPLREPEPVEEAKTFRADQVSLRELARTVLRLAQDRACRPPLDGGESARKWAWMQVKTLTGRQPRDEWPPADWREREWGDPHPVVRRNGEAQRKGVSDVDGDAARRAAGETRTGAGDMDNAVMGTIVAWVAVIQLFGLVAAFAWVWWTELRPRQVLRARGGREPRKD